MQNTKQTHAHCYQGYKRTGTSFTSAEATLEREYERRFNLCRNWRQLLVSVNMDGKGESVRASKVHFHQWIPFTHTITAAVILFSIIVYYAKRTALLGRSELQKITSGFAHDQLIFTFAIIIMHCIPLPYWYHWCQSDFDTTSLAGLTVFLLLLFMMSAATACKVNDVFCFENCTTTSVSQFCACVVQEVVGRNDSQSLGNGELISEFEGQAEMILANGNGCTYHCSFIIIPQNLPQGTRSRALTS